MNLKPYKSVVHEKHTIRFPFLDRNAFLIIMGVIILVGVAAYYFWG